MIWLRFAVIQLLSLVATVVGWLLLIPFCLVRAWTTQQSGQKFVSMKDLRSIDRWSWGPLNYVYGNPEDGVSGQHALVNGDQPYMPNAWAPWRAYLWTGWRNSADNLKYVFAYKDGPLKTGTIFGKPYKIGWQQENGYNVPVISFG